MGWGVGRFMVLVGMVLFLHSGYSTTHYKRLVEISGTTDAPAIPFDVIVEVFAAFGVTLLGVMVLAGGFKPIHVAEVVESSYDVLNARPDFAMYNDRGKAFAKLRGAAAAAQ